jgi:hypothetical protein
VTRIYSALWVNIEEEESDRKNVTKPALLM